MDKRLALPRFALRGDVVQAARWCLGKRLVVTSGGKQTSGIIVETEAYGGAEDRACHAYRKRTARNAAMFGPPGTIYVYRIYGMYRCVNLVVGPVDEPKAVLIRAIAPETGLGLMRERRAKTREVDLCSGPGKLCQAMAISVGEHNGEQSKTSSSIYLAHGVRVAAESVYVSPRIGITQSIDFPWRFFLADSPHVSKGSKYVREGTRPQKALPSL